MLLFAAICLFAVAGIDLVILHASFRGCLEIALAVFAISLQIKADATTEKTAMSTTIQASKRPKDLTTRLPIVLLSDRIQAFLLLLLGVVFVVGMAYVPYRSQGVADLASVLKTAIGEPCTRIRIEEAVHAGKVLTNGDLQTLRAICGARA